MLAPAQVEMLICLVASLDRPAVVRHLQTYSATFPIDFTEDFLNSLSVDRLRHIFVALCLQQQHLPEMLTNLAA